ELRLLCFDEAFAASRGYPVFVLDAALMILVVMVTLIGLQAVGLILMVALLVIPAAAARFWTERMSAMALISAAIGAASALVGAGMSAKALPKRDPAEKVGNFCLIDGKVTVIEYSDLPDELAHATCEDGRLKFGAGSIAIHVLSREFVEQIAGNGSGRLPFHRALKKVPCLDPGGNRFDPDEPNAVKLEKFIFDAMPMAPGAVVLETVRSEEFSPVKSATGVDSLVTSLHDQIRRAADWLEAAGVAVPRDAQGHVASPIEISPLYALDAEQLAEKVDPKLTIRPQQELYLE
ncbi:hypothetical protein LCGC14_2062260, partial [marine sediment metagenome]